MGPNQDMLSHSSSVALPSNTAVNTGQAVPKLRPPVIRCCGEQTPDVHCEYHLSCAGRVGDGVVAQRVANSDVAVNGERYGDPDGGVDGGELQHLHGVIYGRWQRHGQNKILQYEVDENNEEQDEDVGGCQCQEIVVGGLLTAQHQLGQDDHS